MVNGDFNIGALFVLVAIGSLPAAQMHIARAIGQEDHVVVGERIVLAREREDPLVGCRIVLAQMGKRKMGIGFRFKVALPAKPASSAAVKEQQQFRTAGNRTNKELVGRAR